MAPQLKASWVLRINQNSSRGGGGGVIRNLFYFLELSKSSNISIPQPGLQNTPPSKSPIPTNIITPQTIEFFSRETVTRSKRQDDLRISQQYSATKSRLAGRFATSCPHRCPQCWPSGTSRLEVRALTL